MSPSANEVGSWIRQSLGRRSPSPEALPTINTSVKNSTRAAPAAQARRRIMMGSARRRRKKEEVLERMERRGV